MLIYKRTKKNNMPDYNNGKIYKIVVNNTEDEYRPYIGSTTKEYLSQRLTRHRTSYSSHKNGKRDSLASFNLFDKYGIENCEIILIENYPCTTKDELHARERYWFDNMENCNINKPMRTEEEVNNKGKIYYNKRMEQDTEFNKKLYQRQLELHPDFNEKKKQDKYTCECGSHIRATGKPKHNKTKKHLDYIATIAIQQEV